MKLIVNLQNYCSLFLIGLICFIYPIKYKYFFPYIFDTSIESFDKPFLQEKLNQIGVKYRHRDNKGDLWELILHAGGLKFDYNLDSNSTSTVKKFTNLGEMKRDMNRKYKTPIWLIKVSIIFLSEYDCII